MPLYWHASTMYSSEDCTKKLPGLDNVVSASLKPYPSFPSILGLEKRGFDPGLMNHLKQWFVWGRLFETIVGDGTRPQAKQLLPSG